MKDWADLTNDKNDVQKISELLDTPENTAMIERNKAFSKEVSRYVEDSQNELIRELNMDLLHQI